MANPLSLRVPDDLRRFLQDEADRSGKTVTQVVVDACWQYLDGEKKEPEQEEPVYDQKSKPTIDDLRALVAGIEGKSHEPMFTEPKRCTYEEWNGDIGEVQHCGLMEHGPKVRHKLK